MTLDADEFIRRFLIHALPDGPSPYAAENKEKMSGFCPGQVTDQFATAEITFQASPSDIWLTPA
jgi:hypothetical protein